MAKRRGILNPRTRKERGRTRELVDQPSNEDLEEQAIELGLDENRASVMSREELVKYVTRRVRTEYMDNVIGGNPMAKKKRIRRTRQMKVLGIPVMTAAIIGGLAWWVFTKKS